jgi:hypothetical protein
LRGLRIEDCGGMSILGNNARFVNKLPSFSDAKGASHWATHVI